MKNSDLQDDGLIVLDTGVQTTISFADIVSAMLYPIWAFIVSSIGKVT